MIEDAKTILNMVCQELGLATSASDPYWIDGEYIDWMLEGTEGLIYFDNDEYGWQYSTPSLAEARKIVAAHEDWKEG